jgi:hypothetical protein
MTENVFLSLRIFSVPAYNTTGDILQLISSKPGMNYYIPNRIDIWYYFIIKNCSLNNDYFIGTMIDSNALVKRLRRWKTTGNKKQREKSFS